MKSLSKIAPGFLVCAVAGLAAMALRPLVATVSPLLWAIILGVIVANLTPIPALLQPGIGFTGKKVLRVGIVLLGLQLVLGDILGLGWQALVFVLAIVGLGILSGVVVGRALGISVKQRLLIATGFSICGAAAVAGADGVLDADDEEVATAVALVVLFGSLMIPVVPGIVALIGFDAHAAGIFTGGATHEVAQVVAAAGIIGGSALSTAVLMKMARVLMLAPVIALMSIWARKNLHVEGQKKPPIMPLFVFLFLVAIAISSVHLVPKAWAFPLKEAQTFCLAAAMFALGCGVQIKKLIKVGWRPFALGLAVTLVVGGLAFVGGIVA